MNFNLIDEPFIPCLMADGTQRDWGLRDVLTRAPEIREVRDESPLVTIALHRLLLAILHRNFGPRSLKEWKRLWTAGQFDTSTLNGYFERWYSRFDLLSGSPSFFQANKTDIEFDSGVSRLAVERSGTHNKFMFSHVPKNDCSPQTAAVAGRWLIAHQLTAISGGRGYGASPLSRGIIVLVSGSTLFQTLMLNLVLYDRQRPPTLGADDEDAPIWEREARPTPTAKSPRGYLDYLTWQSRSISLRSVASAQCVSVGNIAYAEGGVFKPNAIIYDPMMAYRRDRARGDRPIGFDLDRALWRDSAALFQFSSTDKFKGPETLATLACLAADGVIPKGVQYSLSCFGLCADDAKIHFVRQEHMPLPVAYLVQRDLVEALTIAIEKAEEVAGRLRGAVFRTAIQIDRDLRPSSEEDSALAMQFTDRNERAVKKRVDRIGDMVKSFSVGGVYWSRLEVPFHRLLLRLAEEDSDMQSELANWVNDVLKQTAIVAFDERLGGLSRSSRMLRAVTLGREQLVRRLNHICRPFKEHQHGQT